MTTIDPEVINEEDIDISGFFGNDIEKKLVVHNDSVNTFESVIEALISVCRHSFAQAEQCALIIHNKGKYAVKTGTIHELKKMKEGITERGIGATIE